MSSENERAEEIYRLRHDMYVEKERERSNETTPEEEREYDRRHEEEEREEYERALAEIEGGATPRS